MNALDLDLDLDDRLAYAKLYSWLSSNRAGETRTNILALLNDTGTISASQLAGYLDLSRSTLDNHLRDLDDWNLIERTGKPTTITVTTPEHIELILNDLDKAPTTTSTATNRPRPTATDFLADLNYVASKSRGHPLTLDYYNTHGHYHTRDAYRLFDSWSTTLATAHLTHRGASPSASPISVRTTLASLALHLDDIPTETDIQIHSTLPLDFIYRTYDTLSDACYDALHPQRRIYTPDLLDIPTRLFKKVEKRIRQLPSSEQPIATRARKDLLTSYLDNDNEWAYPSRIQNLEFGQCEIATHDYKALGLLEPNPDNPEQYRLNKHSLSLRACIANHYAKQQ